MTTSVIGSTQESSVSRVRDSGLLDLPDPPPVARVRRGLRWFPTGIRPARGLRTSVRSSLRTPDESGSAPAAATRSAAFNLGALQALGKRGVLRGARYLSAVSGGAYIRSRVLHGGQARHRSRDTTTEQNASSAAATAPAVSPRLARGAIPAQPKLVPGAGWPVEALPDLPRPARAGLQPDLPRPRARRRRRRARVGGLSPALRRPRRSGRPLRRRHRCPLPLRSRRAQPLLVGPRGIRPRPSSSTGSCCCSCGRRATPCAAGWRPGPSV